MYNFEIYYRSGKHKIYANSLSRIKWPESVDEVVANRNSCIGVNSNIVDAVFQGTSIPYGYVETISKSTAVVPESYLEDNGSMTLDKCKVEQSKDPPLHFLIQILNEGDLLQMKTTQLELNCPEIRPRLKSLKQFQLHNGLLYRKIFSHKHGKWSHPLQLVLPSQLTDQVLKGCHDEVGHLGRDKSSELLRERFYWPSMYRDVVYQLSNCTNCLKGKGVALKAELCPITANRSLELVHMDYLSLKPSKENIENVLVITDHFTRYA